MNKSKRPLPPSTGMTLIAKFGSYSGVVVMELCRLAGEQAKKLLGRLRDEQRLIQHGEKRGSYYTLGPQR